MAQIEQQVATTILLADAKAEIEELKLQLSSLQQKNFTTTTTCKQYTHRDLKDAIIKTLSNTKMTEYATGIFWWS